MGYVGVEVVRGRNRVRHEGGLVWAKKKQKPSRGGLVLASEVWAGLLFGRGNLIRLGYTGIKIVRGHNQVRSEGGLDWAKKSKTEPWRLSFG